MQSKQTQHRARQCRARQQATEQSQQKVKQRQQAKIEKERLRKDLKQNNQQIQNNPPQPFISSSLYSSISSLESPAVFNIHLSSIISSLQ